MKLSVRIISLFLLLVTLVGCFAACGEKPAPQPDGPGEFVDLTADVKFNPDSGRASAEVTVKTYIDGDTTHFYVPSTVTGDGIVDGVLKARYLGINTPESTGQIEPWGKKASNYTKETLSKATSIIIESETNIWNPDSTGERYLVWVWYKTDEMSDYRCLNMEILQQGLAIASKFSDSVYADACNQILNQAVAHKLYVFSEEKDPDFYYGAAIPVTLKELKANMADYLGKSVSFECNIARVVEGTTAYVEEYDEETGLYFGMQVYMGYTLDFFGKEVLKAGNRVHMVGNVQYYEQGGTYQLSDIKYDVYNPSDRDVALIEKGGHGANYQEMTASQLLNGTVNLEITAEDEEGNEVVESKSFDVGYLAMHSTISMKNLTIKRIYTTQTGNSAGAMSITCQAEDGTTIVVRTIVLLNSEGNRITESSFPIGSVIDVKGLVDYYDGEYQVKLLSFNNVTFH